MTFVLTTALFKNGKHWNLKIPKMAYLISITHVSTHVDETVIKIRGNNSAFF